MNEQADFKSDREKLINQRVNGVEPLRSHSPWTEAERKTLTDMYFDGIGYSIMALELERSETSIYAQFHRKGEFPFIKKRRSHRKTDQCKCHACGLRLTCTKNPEFHSQCT